MKTRGAFLVGIALGLAAAAGVSCGTKPAADTTVKVTMYFNPSAGTRQLDISGRRASGVEVFPHSQRPEVPPATAITSPQSVRIYLQSGAAAEAFTITVLGIDDLGAAVEQGSVEVTPKLNADVPVDVFLSPFVAPPQDGGTDAGPLDFDGGGQPCTCDGGCCGPGGTCYRKHVSFASVDVLLFSCGPRLQYCTDAIQVCSSFASDGCASDGGCSCGTTGAACGAGLRCKNGGCVCDESSSCPTCCSSNTVCFRPTNPEHCGGGSFACETCPTNSLGNATVCVGGRCANPNGTGFACGDCNPGECCSGSSCQQPSFPTCVARGGGCLECDLTRNDTCSDGGSVQIVLGDGGPGIATFDCICSGAGKPCGPNELCMRGPNDGGFNCRTLTY